MFKFENVISPVKLERVSGKGLQTPEGNIYPGVTKMLSSFPKPELDAWRARVGEEEAEKIISRSQRTGKALHALCEDFLLGTNELEPRTPLQTQNFNAAKRLFTKYIRTIFGIEVPMYSDAMGLCGYADMLCNWAGRNCVVDLKTSLKLKRKEWLTDYFLQTTSYCVMCEEIYNFKINDMLLIVMVEGESKPQVFYDTSEKWKPILLEKVELWKSNKQLLAS